MEIKEGHILDFNGEYVPAKRQPKVDGYYMTIRCGLGGIYYIINEWKDGRWQVESLDDGYVIAYSKETISKEKVNEWARNKLKEKGF